MSDPDENVSKFFIFYTFLELSAILASKKRLSVLQVLRHF
jgi:hypothetical protein